MTAPYPLEIRQEAVRLRLEESWTLKQISDKLGISTNAIRRWTVPEVEEKKRTWERQNKGRFNRYWTKSKVYRREKWHSDFEFRSTMLLRKRIRRVLNGTNKSQSSIKLLGCRPCDLLAQWNPSYVQQWQEGGDFHIDHIRPCTSFDLANPEQQEVCFNWRNLQLLPAKENLAKRDSWTPEMQHKWAKRFRELGWEGELYLTGFEN